MALALLTAAHAQEGASPRYFEVDALNEGLPPRPDDMDLAAPQTALESFLRAAGDGNWDAAAHALDLRDIARERQPFLGPDLARRLHNVIDRKVLLRWSDMSERPDAMEERGGSSDPMVGEPRRSLLLGVLEIEGREVGVRLNRIKPEGGDAVWVFARPTVANVPALYDLYGPSELEEDLPEWLRADSLFGLHLWEVLFLPVAALLIAVTAVAAWRFFGRMSARSRRWAGRSFLLSARLPATLAITAFLLAFLTSDLLVVSSAASAVIEPTVLLGYVAAVVILIVNVIDAVLARIVTTDPDEMASPVNAEHRSLATGVSAARRLLLVVAALLAVGIVLSSANTFQSLGISLLASAGALTLVLAFAAREVLGNILASLQISLNRSARIGDFLEFEGHWCTVEAIHFTYVQLRLWTGNRLIVPVSCFVTKPFENWSHVEFKMMRLVKLRLAATSDVQPLREAMEAFAARDERIDPQEEAFCYVTDQDEFGLTALFAIPVPVPDAGWAVECELREHLLQEIDRLGIELPAVAARPEAA
ncbi:mechanosensitive ion channel family protein [Roseitranquillus sediminis]|uniref:mechanosensitive ion channel family protein n=1 Tax=Roseitranquillus sediminis TaxID=2809051 RepID=UPI001D0C7CDF|nr:mechanosensitive ion channel domain-containing protein [Roseitranquillus sediminis]MBM9594129.1 mechanosensitive ion channel [Roseitranquillus sediminis]